MFHGELGQLQGTKAKSLKTKNQSPTFLMACFLTFTMNATVYHELLKLKSMTFSDRLTQELKPDCTALLCDDYKLKQNEAIKLEEYHISLIDKLFTSVR